MKKREHVIYLKYHRMAQFYIIYGKICVTWLYHGALRRISMTGCAGDV